MPHYREKQNLKSKCYASDYCQKDKSSCSDVCGGYRVLRALYNLSRIPERYRYTCKDEIHFIIEHYNSYKQMPDKLTFLGRFKDFQMLEVTESTDYLVYKLKEAYTYTKLVPLIEDTAKVVKEDNSR